MNIRKRLLALCLVLVFILTATVACGGANSKEPSGTKEAAGENTGTAAAVTSAEKPLYKIQYLFPGVITNPDTVMSDKTDVGKVIKDKFNIVFESVGYAGDWSQKVNLMLAGGDYPEILWIQYNTDLQKYINAGAAVCLDDYLPNAPEFAKRYEKNIPIWRTLSSDGKLYNWQWSLSDRNVNLACFDIAVRIDLLKQQGYPNLLSEDDWIKFLKKALQDNPTTNGQKSIGMTAPFGESWGMAGIAGIMYEKGGRYTGTAGNGSVIFNHDKDQYEDYFLNEYVLESFKFFNKLYREGILDKESFTDTMAQITEKWNNGRALSTWYIHPGNDVNQKAVERNQPEQQYIIMPIRSNTQVQRNEPRLIMELDNSAFNNEIITKNAKDPQRLFELINWASSEEGQIMLQRGEEGKYWTKGSDGKAVPTDLFLQAKKDSKSTSGLSGYGFLGQDLRVSPLTGQPYDLSLDWTYRDQSLSAQQKETLTQLGWKDSVDYWRKTSKGAPSGIINSIQIDPSSELGQLNMKLTDFRVKNTARLMLAKDDQEFEAIWKGLVEQYQKLNPQTVIDEYNKLYQAAKAKIK